jgi:anti-sigma regulatory factor (Ser/Thr protein kinase)
LAAELWGRRPPPAAGPGATIVARFEPTSLADLTHCRQRMAAALHGESRPRGADEGAVERLLLTLEELVSNALRHGDAPVRLAITAYGTYWLLEVSDAAPHRPPTPAVGRDAARGGLGLYLVARVTGAHGWIDNGRRKTTWARIDYTRAEAPPEEQDGVPRPRRGPRTPAPEH